MSEPNTFKDLVVEFSCCVIAQNEAIRRNNSKVGNRFADRYNKIFDKLIRNGDNGRDALSVLLTDTDKGVRVMAAAYLLRYKTNEATEVLLKESLGEGLLAFGASQCLKRWEEGTWSLDLVD